LRQVRPSTAAQLLRNDKCSTRGQTSIIEKRSSGQPTCAFIIRQIPPLGLLSSQPSTWMSASRSEMDRLERKTLKTSRSLDYTYYASSTTTGSKDHPTLLFCHGFPDSAFLWNDVLTNLGDVPYKIIAPDMLG